MLVATIIIGILAFLACCGANDVWNDLLSSELKCKVVSIIAIMFVILTCGLIIAMSRNEYTTALVLGFLTICAWGAFQETDFDCIYDILFVVFFIATIIGGVVHHKSIEKVKSQEVKVTTQDLVAIKDNSSIDGNKNRSIFYVTGSIKEKAEYTYYYRLEDGGIKQGRINADSTTIYYVEDGKEPYLEITETTPYTDVYKKGVYLRRDEGQTSITYKLYVPEGSVQNVYEFDAN